MIQGSDEWFAARCGKVTASRIADMLTRTKTGWGAGRKNYLAQLVAERLTGKPADSYTNAAMQWGIETEPQARAAYEFFSDMQVTETGFVVHPEIDMSGASPDGIVGEGLVEIKCPNTATHIDTLLNKKIPAKYAHQMNWQMACTGAKWCDFVSFDPRMPADLQFFVKRQERDDEKITELEQQVIEFLNEVDQTINQLKAA